MRPRTDVGSTTGTSGAHGDADAHAAGFDDDAVRSIVDDSASVASASGFTI